MFLSQWSLHQEPCVKNSDGDETLLAELDSAHRTLSEHARLWKRKNREPETRRAEELLEDYICDGASHTATSLESLEAERNNHRCFKKAVSRILSVYHHYPFRHNLEYNDDTEYLDHYYARRETSSNISSRSSSLSGSLSSSDSETSSCVKFVSGRDSEEESGVKITRHDVPERHHTEDRPATEPVDNASVQQHLEANPKSPPGSQLFARQADIDLLDEKLALRRSLHIRYILRNLTALKAEWRSLDASKPWLVYWAVHALNLLSGWSEVNDSELHSLRVRVVNYIDRLWDKNHGGGFGGGRFQLGHLCSNFAAVAALVSVGTDEALGCLDRQAMHDFFLSLKDPISGGFRVHHGGELDLRGTYCAIAVAWLLNILTPGLMEGLSSYIASHQTYAGGLAGEPGGEPHAGYSYCGLAAAILCNCAYTTLNLERFQTWIAMCQSELSGGFRGRINKLADSCYTFWSSAVAVLLFQLISAARNTSKPSYRELQLSERVETAATLDSTGNFQWTSLATIQSSTGDPMRPTLGGSGTFLDSASVLAGSPISRAGCSDNNTCCGFNPTALQLFTLACGQEESRSLSFVTGGFRDKPGSCTDLYHTCYALSGLSVCRYHYNCGPHVDPPERITGSNHVDKRVDLGAASEELSQPPSLKSEASGGGTDLGAQGSCQPVVRNCNAWEVEETSLLFNIEVSKLRRAIKFFHSLPPPGTSRIASNLTEQRKPDKFRPNSFHEQREVEASDSHNEVTAS